MSTKTDWDDAYANMAYVAGSDAFPAMWKADGAAYRDSGVQWDEHSYGSDPRARFDIFWPEAQPKGLAVFVHGGYWLRTGKSDWSQFAEGARQQGWAVCLPQYTLAPEARISEMTAQIGRAISSAAKLVSGPIRLAGHSAGGHLVSRMMCEDTPLAADVMERLEACVSISGLHDLRPIMRTEMNDKLGLDSAEARQESAALQDPHQAARMTAWVGGGERPEFIRQARLLHNAWSGFDVEITLHIDGTHDHFSVIEGLKDPQSALTTCFVGNDQSQT